jgi:hypothetical protein
MWSSTARQKRADTPASRYRRVLEMASGVTAHAAALGCGGSASKWTWNPSARLKILTGGTSSGSTARPSGPGFPTSPHFHPLNCQSGPAAKTATTLSLRYMRGG